MTIDTAALRAEADRYNDGYRGMLLPLAPDDLRALCDGYDEAARLRPALAQAREAIANARAGIEESRKAQAEALAELLDAAGDLIAAAETQQRFAALVADLRALCDADDANDDTAGLVNDIRAVIDRHAPEGDA